MGRLDLLEVEESKEDFRNPINQVIAKVYNTDTTLHDPPIMTTKRHPRTLRMKGGLELLKKKFPYL